MRPGRGARMLLSAEALAPPSGRMRVGHGFRWLRSLHSLHRPAKLSLALRAACGAALRASPGYEDEDDEEDYRILVRTSPIDTPPSSATLPPPFTFSRLL